MLTELHPNKVRLLLRSWFLFRSFKHEVVFYNKHSWFVFELPEKDILKWWSSVDCVGSILQ